MASLTQIFDWFKENLMPTEAQFQETWKSFWHKSEKLPISQILGLQEEIAKATTNFKGYHTSFAELQSAYPQAQNKKDFFAWVGSPYPGTVYKVFADKGAWTDTGEVPTQQEIDLAEYAKKIEVEKKADFENSESEIVVYAKNGLEGITGGSSTTIKEVDDELIYQHGEIGSAKDITGIKTPGSYTNPVNGKLYTGVDYHYSGFIAVQPGWIIRISGCFGYSPTQTDFISGIAGYSLDSQSNFIVNLFDPSFVGNITQGRYKIENYVITIPENVYWIRGSSAFQNSSGKELPLLIELISGEFTQTIKEKVKELDESSVYGYDESAIVDVTGTLTTGSYSNMSIGALIASTQYHHSGFIEVLAGEKIRITACLGYNPADLAASACIAGYSNNSLSSFVKSVFDPKLAGETKQGRYRYVDQEIVIPAGVNYIIGSSAFSGTTGNEIPLIIKKIKGDNISVKAKVKDLDMQVQSIKTGVELETKLRVMTYNIGHYSDAGGNNNSPITEAQYEQKKLDWRKLMYNIGADIVGLQEYSPIFCAGNGATSYNSIYKDLFSNHYEGVQRRYSCNAFFSTHYVRSIELKEYECNKTAEITHTSAIKATDYYYLLAEMVINGKEVCLIVTHLAFDLNNVQVELDQIDELITILNTKERVIVLGDFNVHHGASGFDAFINAGYTIANNGYIGNIPTYPYPNMTKTLDNVVCSKNIKIKKVLADFVPMNTNDHIPFVADIVI